MNKITLSISHIFTLVFFIFFTICVCAEGKKEQRDETLSTIALQEVADIQEVFEETIESTLVLPSEVRSRPDILIQAYLDAYPDYIESVAQQDGEWILQFRDGSEFYWANGRLLLSEKKDSWENYSSYQIYAYTGNPRNPDLYTPEQIERLRNRTNTSTSRDTEPRVPQPVQDVDFWNAIFGIGNRVQTEENLISVTLFGKSVTVNRQLVEKLKLIDEEVTELAKTDTEVADFLETLYEVSGYNWRNIAGTSRPSSHSYGLAIDVLPRNWGSKMLYWSWVSDFNDDWMLVPQEDIWTPPQQVVKVFEKYGFIWGGVWDIYDTMHFEYKPECIALNRYILYEGNL